MVRHRIGMQLGHGSCKVARRKVCPSGNVQLLRVTMNPSVETPTVPQSLHILGITPIEEAVYRRLLRAPGSTAEMLAASLNIPAAELAAAVGELERKGFATFAPEREPRLFPSPPDIAIESLLLLRQKELQLARLAIAELQREQISTPDGNPVVEIIDADP